MKYEQCRRYYATHFLTSSSFLLQGGLGRIQATYNITLEIAWHGSGTGRGLGAKLEGADVCVSSESNLLSLSQKGENELCDDPECCCL